MISYFSRNFIRLNDEQDYIFLETIGLLTI